MRSQLNSDMIERTIALLAQANRVEFYTVGQYGGVAVDAQFKFLRFGIPSAAYVESRLQTLAASVLKPGDVAVVISSGGRLPELLEVADLARERGAAVVAITASQSPLARKADTVLAVDHVEDASTHVPMVSRILQLLMIDILTVGVAMRRPVPEAGTGALEAATVARPPRPAPPAPGSDAAASLSRMTLHSR
jgi:glucokinase